jgi:hypothetical protein
MAGGRLRFLVSLLKRLKNLLLLSGEFAASQSGFRVVCEGRREFVEALAQSSFSTGSDLVFYWLPKEDGPLLALRQNEAKIGNEFNHWLAW